MEVEISYNKFEEIREGMIVVFIDRDEVLGESKDEEIDSLLLRLRDDYKGKKIKREMYFTDIGGVKGRNMLVYWTGLNVLYPPTECIKVYIANALDLCQGYGIKVMNVLLNTKEGSEYIESVVEGVILGSYRFNKYKRDRDDFFNDFTLRIVGNYGDRVREGKRLERRLLISRVINECRDIVNEPGSVMYPEVMAELAESVGKECGMKVRVLRDMELLEGGYNGLIQVGKGSMHSPCMVVMEYEADYPIKVGLVGKGITFDTGGISLKPSAKMSDMKGDMAGAAAVMYTMKVIAKLGLDANLLAIMPLAENFPGAKAQKPGDIFYAKNGKSVAVENTDAEGRLILTDAFYLAGEEKCNNIIDIATLTGSCVKALGTSVAGIMGNDKKLISAVIRAGREEGEEFWELPLVEEYKEMLKSNIADLNNIGGENAGVITAALFLREFIPEEVSWVHLDIAGPYMQGKQWKYYEAGATGFGLKTLVNLIYNFNYYYFELDNNKNEGKRL